MQTVEFHIQMIIFWLCDCEHLLFIVDLVAGIMIQ